MEVTVLMPHLIIILLALVGPLGGEVRRVENQNSLPNSIFFFLTLNDIEKPAFESPHRSVPNLGYSPGEG